MATGQMNEVIRHVRRTVLLRDVAGVTYGQQLEGGTTPPQEADLGAPGRADARTGGEGGEERQGGGGEAGRSEGTVAGRLARARLMLAKRLARHGLAVSGGALAAVLSQSTASASVPTSVVSSTIKAASLFAAGQAA